LKDTGILELKPLTLLVGPNSSGKTALLQAILVLKQTLESRNIETPLVLRGKYVNLGSFKDIVFRHNIKENIEISLGLPAKERKRIARHTSDTLKTYRDVMLMKIKIGYDAKSERLVNRGVEFFTSKINLRVTKEKIEILYNENVISHKFKRSFEIERRNFLYIPRFSLLRFHFHDVLLLKKYKKELLNKKAKLEALLKEKTEDKNKIELKKTKLIMSIKELENRINFLEMRLKKLYGTIDIEQMEIIARSLDAFREASFNIQTLLTEYTYYIGPLRVYPQRYYIASGEYPRDVGLRGEYTAEIIYFDLRRREEKYTKLKHWMKEADLAYDIRLRPVAEGIYALVDDPKLNIEVNFSDIGFGASQLLPIIVEGIYAKKGSLLLIEQPEIHLHPRLQAMLADLLIDIVKEGKQVIVETHSEHIILRLQRRIAENKLSYRDVAIYYFEPSSEGSKITHVKLDKDGIIKSWPKGFFEEDLEESYFLLKALGEKRKDVSGN